MNKSFLRSLALSLILVLLTGAALAKRATLAAEAPDTIVAAPSAAPAPKQTGAQSDGASKALDFFRDTTISGTVDGYYGYNFNRPVGRINLLRAYDVTSNSFSLNQAVISIERAPNVDAGRRFGYRQVDGEARAEEA